MYDDAESAATEKAQPIFDDAINDQPKVQESRLNQNSRGPQKTKAQYAKELRENKTEEFVKKREIAKEKLQKSKEMSLIAKGPGKLPAQQLGLPYRKYSEIDNSLGKLKQNLDLILSGKMSLAEHE